MAYETTFYVGKYLMDEFLFSEKYRPRTISECIIPERLKKTFQEYVNKGIVPSMMLTGSPGIGKTTVALALCKEIGLSHIFINASKERGIDTLRVKIDNYASTMSLIGGRKVIILDEADRLTPEAQDALRGTIEACSSNATFILTCNIKGRLIEAIHSRCAVIDFTLTTKEKPAMASQFLKRMEMILTTEGITFERPVLVRLVQKHFPDFRRTLNELQRHSISGAIDASVLEQVSDIRNMEGLVKALKGKDFNEARKWVAVNNDIDHNKIYRRIFDSLDKVLVKTSIPLAITILNTHQYQAAFVADQEICLIACLVNLMVDTEFVE